VPISSDTSDPFLVADAQNAGHGPGSCDRCAVPWRERVRQPPQREAQLPAADYQGVRTQIGQTSITILRRNMRNRNSGEDISASDMVGIVLSPLSAGGLLCGQGDTRHARPGKAGSLRDAGADDQVGDRRAATGAGEGLHASDRRGNWQ